MNELDYCKDNYWQPRGSSKLLTYVGPALKNSLDLTGVKKFVRDKGAFGAMWNYDLDYAQKGPWYRVICDTLGYDKDKIKSKNARHNISRGLKRCKFRPIEHKWLAENGYQVYVNAASRYTSTAIESQKQFSKRILGYDSISGREVFGIFVDDVLAAYVTLSNCGSNVYGDTARFDPAFSNSYPMYALYYSIAYHYLTERGCTQLDCGTRPLIHETNIGDFLVRIGYRKAYCRLGAYFARPVRVTLSVARPLRKLFKVILPSRYHEILNALLQTQDIANQTKEKSKT